jgi:hypothetical protein
MRANGRGKKVTVTICGRRGKSNGDWSNGDCHLFSRLLARRWFFGDCGVGLAGIAAGARAARV